MGVFSTPCGVQSHLFGYIRFGINSVLFGFGGRRCYEIGVEIKHISVSAFILLLVLTASSTFLPLQLPSLKFSIVLCKLCLFLAMHALLVLGVHMFAYWREEVGRERERGSGERP